MFRTIVFTSLLFILTLLCHGQSQNNISVRIDPDDWNQFVYTRSVAEKDSVLFHYWIKRNKDQLIRVNWQRTQKVSKVLSVTYGFGGQVLKNQATTDPQGFVTVGARVAVRKLTVAAPVNFNISWQLPLVVKTIPTVQYKLHNRVSIGYRSEMAKNSKGRWLENRHGATVDYVFNRHFSVGLWNYFNLRTSKPGATYAVTYKF